MGGRGSGSNMNGRVSSGAGGSARNDYNAAEAERRAITSITPSQRTPEQRQQLERANDRADAAGNKIMANEMTKTMVERAMNRYIDNAIETEGIKKTESWLKSMAGTKKDGSATKTALEHARARVGTISLGVQNALGIHIMSYNLSDDNKQRMIGPMLDVARRRMRGGLR